jgi:chromate transporter
MHSVEDGNRKSTQRTTHIGNEPLGSLFLTFLKIGFTAFGGFMALISVVQDYSVERKKLLTQNDMLDGISLATVLPGPVAVNVVTYVGYRVRGRAGALVAATGVILPAFLLILGLSYTYFSFGRIPMVAKLFQGFIPAVSAVIASAAWNMSIKTVRGVSETMIALIAGSLLLGVGGFFISIAALIFSGAAGWFLFRKRDPGFDTMSKVVPGKTVRENNARSSTPLRSLLPPTAGLAVVSVPTIAKIFAVFAGMSVFLFGGGYVFVPLIQKIVVDGYGWVTRQEFIDGIALGQVTPGPILISAAFIGYKTAGFLGALAATIGIFTPPAVIMLICTRGLDRIKRSDSILACLKGIRPAVVGMIAAAAVTVIRSAPLSAATFLIFCASLVALVRFKLETAWIIPAAGLCGLFLY